VAEVNPIQPAGGATNDAAGAALARYYDLDLAEDQPDVDLYRALAAASDGPILELGAGTGRVAVPLAAAGRDVVAVDRDPHMLERARARWAAASHPAGRGSLELVEADMTDYRPGSRFDLVLIALNSLLLLERGDAQRAALETMALSLTPHGQAVIDVWLPTPDDLALYDGRSVLDWVRRDEELDEWVSKSTSAIYYSASNSADVTAFFDAWRDGGPARRTMRRDRIAFVTVGELTALVASVGLVVDTIAGDYDINPLRDHSDRIVLVCRRRSG